MSKEFKSKFCNYKLKVIKSVVENKRSMIPKLQNFKQSEMSNMSSNKVVWQEKTNKAGTSML